MTKWKAIEDDQVVVLPPHGVFLDREVGALLRHTRSNLGISQAEIARRTGISRSYLYRIDKGKVGTTFGTLARIADAMGCRLKIQLSLPDGTPVSVESPANMEPTEPKE